MGNFTRTIVIAFWLQACLGNTVNVLKDKRRDKKSIEVMMESFDNNPHTNQSEINKLVINSTYDDSVFISTFLKHGVNITVIQDHKSVVDVNNKSTTIDDEVIKLESEANTLMQNQTIPLKALLDELTKLFLKAEELRKHKPDEKSMRRLASLGDTLRLKYKTLYEKTINGELSTLINKLKNAFNSSNIGERELNEYDGVVAEILKLVPRTADYGLKMLCRQILGEFQRFAAPFRIQTDINSKINQIRKSFREELFVPNNASIVEKTVAELDQLQATKADEKNAVKSLKREAVDLAEAVNVIATAENVLHSNAQNVSTRETENSLKDIAAHSKNRNLRRIAYQLAPQLASMKKNQETVTKDMQSWEKTLHAINQTLESPQGFGGKAGLLIIEEKLRNIIRIARDEHMKKKARKLIQTVKGLEEGIDEVLEFFTRIDKVRHVPKSDAEVEQYEAFIDKVRKLTRRVDDAEVSIKSQQLINEIQKGIQEYNVQKQINNINSVLRNMNNSLEKAETSDKIREDVDKLNLLENAMRRSGAKAKGSSDRINKILKKIDKMKSMIPEKTKEIALKQDLNELIKVFKVYEREAVAMGEKFRKVFLQYRNLSKITNKDLDMSGLFKRINDASRDFSQSLRALNTVEKDLKKFHVNKDDSQEVEEFANTFDMLSKVFKLKRLFNDPKTVAITRRMITIVQNIDHTRSVVEQLVKMIKFNTQLLSQHIEETTTSPLYTTETPSIRKVSLLPLVTESSSTDPDKVLQKGSAKNSSKHEDDTGMNNVTEQSA